jgi:hypothetical protein
LFHCVENNVWSLYGPSRIRIVGGAECICLKDYETVDHLIWHCGRFETKKRRLTDALTAQEMHLRTPVLDLCALKKWRAMKSVWISSEVEFDDLAVLLQGQLVKYYLGP